MDVPWVGVFLKRIREGVESLVKICLLGAGSRHESQIALPQNWRIYLLRKLSFLSQFQIKVFKVCSINFEPPDNDLCSACHVYPLSRRAWIIPVLFISNRFTWGLNYII